MGLYLAGEEQADALLERDAFALLVGMVLDQQIPLERAFAAPLELAHRLGHPLDASEIAGMDKAVLVAAFSERPALHRFPAAMADRVATLARLVVEEYGGDAAAIWTTAPDGAELFARVRSLPGFGEQKARIFIALLGKQLGIATPGWREAAGRFGEDGSRLSVADIDSPESLAAVRAHKAQMKAASKSLGALGSGAAAGGRAGGTPAGRGRGGPGAAPGGGRGGLQAGGRGGGGGRPGLDRGRGGSGHGRGTP